VETSFTCSRTGAPACCAILVGVAATAGAGPGILGRLELLSKALSRAGVADADLNAAIWSLWNYLMGATITRASFDLSDDDRAAALQRLAGLSESYPTIERSRLLLDNDWDGAFRKGLAFLLDGLAPRQ
jgi:hypothetical protein